MHVRALVSDELQAVLRLYEGLHTKDEPLPPMVVVQRVWQEAIANPRCRYFGGFEHGELVSTCTIMVIPNLTRGCRPYALIENVVTAPEHRKKGWGRAVLGAALAFAWEEGCYKVMLLTGRKDEATRKFYVGAGFDPDGKQAFVARAEA